MGSLCRVLTSQTSLAIKLRGVLELVIELALGAFAWGFCLEGSHRENEPAEIRIDSSLSKPLQTEP